MHRSESNSLKMKPDYCNSALQTIILQPRSVEFFQQILGLGQTAVDPEIKLTVTKLEKNIRKSGAVLGYHALSLLNALQGNRPTKSEYKLQA